MLKVAGSGVSGALIYKGAWNASTNTPTLSSGIGTKGEYYVVSVAGNTNLDGITDWQVNDWAIFNGLVWQKIDNTDAVSSVNGQTGVVVLTPSDIGAASNTTYVIAGTGMSGGGQLNSNVTLTNAGVTAFNTRTGNITLSSTDISTALGYTPGSGNGTVTSVTGTSPVVSSGGSTPAISMPAANTSVSGYLTSTDWNTFNNKGNGTVTSVTGTAPIVSSGGATPAISIPAANATTSGYLTSTDWNTFNSKGSGTGTVSNVATGTGLTGGPITTTGTISLANTTVTAGSYGNASTVASFTVDDQGRLTSASNVTIGIPVAAVSGAVPNTRNVTASTGLTGGGNLSSDISFAVTANSTQQLVMIQNNGVNVGLRQIVNFAPGNNVTITSADDSSNGRANVTIAVSGLGTMATQNSNNVTITGGNINVQTTNLTSTTSSSATFATASLPLVPAGYIQVDLNGTVVKIPYYAV
jgi:hypothetical protein